MNRLRGQASPYLLAHADDPVPWWPWGREAFDEATVRDLPVLVSIGYSACHWCHVMHHETFQDPVAATFLAERFVCVKVDREEHPDVDAVFMAALQAMRGQGGWPLTAVADSTGRPFFAATYLPPRDAPGIPSFTRVMRAIDDAWIHRRDVLLADASRLHEHLERAMAAPASPAAGPAVGTDGGTVTSAALEALERLYDERYGGFGGAPKFPNHGVLRWLSTLDDPRARAMAHGTLEAIARGGIVDPLSGGPARYAVDEAWRVPHFEKMLSDAAQLLPLWAEAAVAGGGDVHERAATSTFDFLEREMQLESGLYATALDADAPDGHGGWEEGAFYVWTGPAFDDVARRVPRGDLGVTEADVVAFARKSFDVHDVGPFEGRNVLRDAVDPGDAARHFGWPNHLGEVLRQRLVTALHAERDTRPRPARDEKVLTELQGLAIRGLARAGRQLRHAGMVEAAERVARATWETMWSPSDGLRRRAFDGAVGIAATLGDHAQFGLGLLELHHATGDVTYVHRACTIAREAMTRFAPSTGGFTSIDPRATGPLRVVPRNVLDGALPADTVAAAELTWRVARLLDDPAMEARAVAAVTPLEAVAHRHPDAVGTALTVLAAMRRPPVEVVVTGDDGEGGAWGGDALWSEVAKRPLDGVTLLRVRREADVAETVHGLTNGRFGASERVVAWPCHDRVCTRPIEDARDLAAWLDALR